MTLGVTFVANNLGNPGQATNVCIVFKNPNVLAVEIEPAFWTLWTSSLNLKLIKIPFTDQHFPARGKNTGDVQNHSWDSCKAKAKLIGQCRFIKNALLCRITSDIHSNI